MMGISALLATDSTAKIELFFMKYYIYGIGTHINKVKTVYLERHIIYWGFHEKVLETKKINFDDFKLVPGMGKRSIKARGGGGVENF